LEEVAKLYQAECIAQKARKEVETKTREKAKKRRRRKEHWSTSNNSGMKC